jgi:hypothetical protein
MEKAILNYVLTFGPFKGQTIGQAADLYLPDGTLQEQCLQEGIFHVSKGIDWMSWYLSHYCDWMNKAERPMPDRKEIAMFLTNYRNCYKVQPYLDWAST